MYPRRVQGEKTMNAEDRTAVGRSVKERLTVPLILAALGLVLMFVWFNAGYLLIIFTTILVASFFDACTRGLGMILPIRRAWRLAIVLVALAAVMIPALVRGVANLPAQMRSLIRVMDSQLDKLHQYLIEFGIETLGTEAGRDISQLIPDPSCCSGTFNWRLARPRR